MVVVVESPVVVVVVVVSPVVVVVVVVSPVVVVVVVVVSVHPVVVVVVVAGVEVQSVAAAALGVALHAEPVSVSVAVGAGRSKLSTGLGLVSPELAELDVVPEANHPELVASVDLSVEGVNSGLSSRPAPYPVVVSHPSIEAAVTSAVGAGALGFHGSANGCAAAGP